MVTLNRFLTTLNRFLWGLPMILLLSAVHLFLTWKTGFIQKKLPLAIRLSLAPESGSEGDISPFGALSTALASTLGTGNIIGVGTAVALGGPGAVFWCWITGVFGIATTYGEALIAVRYRIRTSDGRMLGGAMYALEYGLHRRIPALLFALCGVLASFGIGCAVQISAISAVLPLPPLAVGAVAGFLTCLVIFGGISSVSRVCQKLVPFMAAFYLLGCLYLLWHHRLFLLPALRLILESAFAPRSVSGGLAGSGILLAARYGIARGLFTNEAGMGSAPIAAAAARCSDPVRQALVASTATFWDTVVICLITGLVIVSSLLATDPSTLFSGAPLSGEALTLRAFTAIPVLGRPLLLFSIITFAYATILGWSYYGERCLEYMVRFRRRTEKQEFFLYRFFWILTLVFAPVLKLSLVFSLADTLNALMALPNLLALILLSDVIARDTHAFFRKEKL